jgi:hypothetical protein
MSSLAPLAHAAASPPFNGLFYATTATIIPVLFLAIAVQGRGYENLINSIDVVDPLTDDSGPWYTVLGRMAAYLALFMAAGGILIYGVLSEIAAIYALYQQQAESGTGQLVLTGVIFLIIATAAGPALTLLSVTLAGKWRLNMGAIWRRQRGRSSRPARSSEGGSAACGRPLRRVTVSNRSCGVWLPGSFVWLARYPANVSRCFFRNGSMRVEATGRRLASESGRDRRGLR